MDRRPASGKRVLLVEDRPEGLSVLRAALGERGFEVLEARNADEALELARKEPPDLAVIAVLTAVTDGCRLLRLWKSDPGLKAIPLVVVSSSCADPQVALGLGADAFLSGPAQLLDLLDRLGARTGPLAAALQPVIPCESCLALVHRLEDRIAQLELANRDLRDRQARLTASERRFRGMIERSSDVVVLLDADGTMRYRSDSGQRIFGFEDDEVLGHPFGDFIHPEDLPVVAESFARLLRTPGESFFVEFRYWRPDGPWGHADATVTNWLEDPDILAVVGNVRDITARKQAEERAEHLSRLYATLSQVSQTIVRVKTREELFPAICRAAVEHGRFALAWLALQHPATQGLSIVAAHGAAAERLLELGADPGDGLMRRALATGQLALSRDLQSEPISRPWLELAEAFSLRAVATAPFSHQAMSAGVFGLASTQVDAFTDTDLQGLLTEMASNISAALDGIEQEARLRRADLESTRARAFADGIIESLPGVFYLFDARGRFVRWNKGFETVSGYSADEIARMHPTDPFTGEERELIRQRIGIVLAEGASDAEAHFTSKDGTRTPYYFTGRRILLDGQEHLVGVGVDLTANKQAEEKVAASEAHFRTLIENASDLVTVLDAEGVIRFQGPSIERLMGYRPEEVLGRLAAELVHPEDLPLMTAVSEQALTSPGLPTTAEFRFRHQDGSWRWIQSIGRSTIDSTGQRVFVVNSRDVTTSRAMEEQLRQSQKMEAIGRLAGGVAHDFNNILAIILMQIELTLSEVELPARAQEGLEQIRQAAEQAANLTRQLLLFGRRQVMQAGNLDLNETVSRLARMLQRILGEDIRLELQLHPEPLWARADAGMLDQVLMNLAVNARDAMSQGGRLLIETEARVVRELEADLHPDAMPGRWVCMRVSDTGSGIPPEVLPRVFEPFFTTKEPGKGTGLGLATVFGIVKQHSGWITAQSEAGRGTTFEVFLPALERTRTGKTREQARPACPGGSETILLVEDDPAVRAKIWQVLKRSGYEVLEAGSGKEALEIWTRARPVIALLLTDLVMPEGLSGQELARRLRAERPDLKVLYVSGYSAELAGRQLELLGGESFLPKPFAPDVLLETIRRALDA